MRAVSAYLLDIIAAILTLSRVFPIVAFAKTEHMLPVFEMGVGENLSTYSLRVQGMYCPTLKMCDKTAEGARDDVITPFIDLSCYMNLCEVGGCYCDSVCSAYGDCCPNAASFSRNMGKSICTDLNIKGIATLLHKHKTYAMVSNCKARFAEDDIVSKCDSSDDLKITEFERNVPVTSNELITFKNQYCAMCNGITDYVTWSFRVVCKQFLKLPSYKSEEDILDMLIENAECDFQLIPPFGKKDLRECRSLTNIKSDCIGSADGYFDDKCSLYTTLFMNYRNVFCFLCNGGVNVTREEKCKFEYNEDPEYDYPSFSAIMHPNMTNTTTEIDGCHQGYRYDGYTGDCREIHCPAGKWLRGTKCVTIIQLRGIYSFEVTVVYTFSNKEEANNLHIATSVEIKFVPDEFHEDMDTVAYRKEVIGDGIDVRSFCEGCARIVVAYTFTVQVKAMEGNIDNYENRVNELRQTVHSVLTERYGEISLTPNEALAELYVAAGGSLPNMTETKVWADKKNDHERFSLKEYYLRSIPTNQFRNCPTVQLNMSEVMMLEDGHSLFIPALNISLQPGQYSILNNDTVRMCADFYFSSLIILRPREESTTPRQIFETTNQNENTVRMGTTTSTTDNNNNNNNNYNNTTTTTTSNHNHNNNGGNDTDTLQEKTGRRKKDNTNKILGIIAQCVSTTGLLVTFIGYCIERALMTPPGIKTMTLLLCLLVGQNSYLFGIDHTANDLVCKAIAIGTHYAWIAAATIVNAGCFYMFRVFGSLLNAEMPSPDSKAEVIVWLCYVFTLPVITVLINIFASLMSHNDFGYGKYECFISHTQMFIYSFVVPMGIILFTNILLSVLILLSIRGKVGIQNIAIADRKYTIMFLMISTLMAMTWACGFIYETSFNIYASYAFTFLNSLIGVYLFVAFYCNWKAIKNAGERRKLYMAPKITPRMKLEDHPESDVKVSHVHSGNCEHSNLEYSQKAP